MGLHDLITNELITQKSLSALIWLINHGRELEFKVNDTVCFISCSHSKRTVSLWINQAEQYFDYIEELIANATIHGIPFLISWNDAVIITVF